MRQQALALEGRRDLLDAQAQLATLDDIVHPPGNGHQPGAGAVDLVAVDMHPVASGLLGGIAGHLQVTEQVDHVVTVAVQHNPKAHADAMGVPLPLQWIGLYRGAQGFGLQPCRGAIGLWQHHGEVHATDSRQGGIGGQQLPQQAGRLLQVGVASQWTKAGIEHTELVDMGVDKGTRLAGGQGLGHRGLETATVEQTGQLVMTAGVGNITVELADDVFQVILNHAMAFRRRRADPAGRQLLHQGLRRKAARLAALTIDQNIVIGSRVGPDQLQVLALVRYQPVTFVQLLQTFAPALLGRVEAKQEGVAGHGRGLDQLNGLLTEQLLLHRLEHRQMAILPGQKVLHALAQQLQNRSALIRPLHRTGAAVVAEHVGLQPGIELTDQGQVIAPLGAVLAIADQLVHQQLAPAHFQPVQQHLGRQWIEHLGQLPSNLQAGLFQGITPAVVLTHPIGIVAVGPLLYRQQLFQFFVTAAEDAAIALVVLDDAVDELLHSLFQYMVGGLGVIAQAHQLIQGRPHRMGCIGKGRRLQQGSLSHRQQQPAQCRFDVLGQLGLLIDMLEQLGHHRHVIVLAPRQLQAALTELQQQLLG